jgi:hypothetical protein
MRGQTTLDFATGVSVFLLVILFVFTFVPGILTPFTQTAQEETVTVNRVADLISKDIVAEPGEPYLLDGRCTAALLSDSAGPGCGFDGATLDSRLDLGGLQSVNVTMRGSPGRGGDELLCVNESTHRVVNATSAGCTASDTVLRAGQNTPESASSVVTARRVVTVSNRIVTLEVEVW